MRTELKAKFIQHLNTRKKSEKGFTLVELLVVIIIIGILTAIALPNFLNQNAKAKQGEAKQNVSAINRVQISLRTERNAFTTNFDQLAIGSLAGNASSVTTTNYSYTLAATADSATIVAQSRDSALKSYLGGNQRYTNTASESTVGVVTCEALQPSSATVTGPTFAVTNGVLTKTCTTGFTEIGT
jgi:type IV pilus assembly protein PilA